MAPSQTRRSPPPSFRGDQRHHHLHKLRAHISLNGRGRADMARRKWFTMLAALSLLQSGIAREGEKRGEREQAWCAHQPQPPTPTDVLDGDFRIMASLAAIRAEQRRVKSEGRREGGSDVERKQEGSDIKNRGHPDSTRLLGERSLGPLLSAPLFLPPPIILNARTHPQLLSLPLFPPLPPSLPVARPQSAQSRRGNRF